MMKESLSFWSGILIPFCPNAKSAEAIAGLESVRFILSNFPSPVNVRNGCASLIAELNGKIPS